MSPARVLVTCFLWTGLWTGAAAISAQPNIVVIMTDDLSLDAFDALADGGWLPNIQNYLLDGCVRFSNAFVTDALCCPSRATFLTGQYPHNHGVLSNQSPDPYRSGIAWPGWFPSATDAGNEARALPEWLRSGGAGWRG